jgi:hypothetical protein
MSRTYRNSFVKRVPELDMVETRFATASTPALLPCGRPVLVKLLV